MKKKEIKEKSILFLLGYYGISLTALLILVVNLGERKIISEALALILMLIIGIGGIFFLWLVSFFAPDIFTKNNKFKKSYKFDIDYSNFEHFSKNLTTTLEKQNFIYFDAYTIDGKDEQAIVYYRELQNKKIEMFLVVNMHMFNKTKIKSLLVNNQVINKLLDQLNKQGYKDIIPFLLICTDKYSDSFESFLKNSNDEFGNNLNVGLIFEYKKIYIPKLKELDYLSKGTGHYYKKMIKRFIEILNIH